MQGEEDYRTLFFTECDELLAELQDQLSYLSDGNADRDSLDAAFRAVHSVKGGAAAFGMEGLAEFAHEFEAVMDACRSGDLEPDATVLPVLLRASDIMMELVEHVRSDAALRPDAIAQTRTALSGLLNAEDPVPAPPSEPEPASEPEPDAPEPPSEGDSVTITFTPLEDFISSGHDAVRMLRSAPSIGLLHVEAEGAVPDLADLDPMVCPWTWSLTFEIGDPAALRDFFSIYDLTARIEGLPSCDAPQTVPEQVASAVRAVNPGPPPTFTKSLRVPLDRIDRLVNLVGEIVITQAAVAQELQQAGREVEDGLDHNIDALSRQVREMQDSVMSIRAQPIKSVFSRMPRIVRDLCETLGREVRIEVEGEETEVDTSVIEELVEPLTHMIRNAMDHGFEAPDDRLAHGKPRQGLLRLSAQHRGERVVITLEDDGRGIDRVRVAEIAQRRGLIESADGMSEEDIDNLIFLPGFSTASSVSNVSGRGVGMDVVRRKIQALGGRCMTRSLPGQGTRFQLTLPLTLAVLEGMIVEISGERFVLPLSTVIEALQLRGGNVERLHNGQRIVARRGEYLPAYELEALFSGTVAAPVEQRDVAIVVDTEVDGHVALFVDALHGQRQVVLKGLESNFKPVRGVSGATILGDGRIALILDLPSLMESRTRPTTAAPARQESA